MSNSDVLFSTYDLDDVLRSQMREVHDRVLRLSNSHFSASSDDELADRIVRELTIEPIHLDEEGISVSHREDKVDVSQDFRRAVYDRNKPAYVDGIRVTFHVPFTGEKKLFSCRPNPYSMRAPHAVVGKNELAFSYAQPGRDIANLKPTFEDEFARAKEWTSRVNQQVVAFNGSLADTARRSVAERRQVVAHTEDQVNALGYKIRRPK
ncbi:MAG TPA: hypothetical protein VGB24_13760 [Longimicrobium sp.]|jgi:hypothetical protein|uniref:hypothetical protein n=1 Tax=Longimicrobium sp. TaxID=2029185 RepID=UPI002EDB6DC7